MKTIIAILCCVFAIGCRSTSTADHRQSVDSTKWERIYCGQHGGPFSLRMDWKWIAWLDNNSCLQYRPWGGVDSVWGRVFFNFSNEEPQMHIIHLSTGLKILCNSESKLVVRDDHKAGFSMETMEVVEGHVELVDKGDTANLFGGAKCVVLKNFRGEIGKMFGAATNALKWLGDRDELKCEHMPLDSVLCRLGQMYYFEVYNPLGVKGAPITGRLELGASPVRPLASIWSVEKRYVTFLDLDDGILQVLP